MSNYDHRLWALTRGELDPAGYDSIDWTAVNGAWRARVPVAAKTFEDGELTIEMVVRPGPRACQPTVVLLAGDQPVRRVDVHGDHRQDGEPRRQTHVQGEPPPDFLAWVDPAVFSDFPESGPVGGEDYYRVFVAAAKQLGTDVSGVEWTDPPEGRP